MDRDRKSTNKVGEKELCKNDDDDDDDEYKLLVFTAYIGHCKK